MVPIPGARRRCEEEEPDSGFWSAQAGTGPIRLTDLVGQLRELDLHLLPLEQVVLGLLADGRDLVELAGHRVRLLQPAGTAVTQEPPLPTPPPTPPLTMISTELHLEVPQYSAIPWLITWVMARTVSAGTDQPIRQGSRWGVGRGHAPHCNSAYPRSACWGPAGWRKRRPRSPAGGAAATPTDLAMTSQEVGAFCSMTSQEVGAFYPVSRR